MNCYKFIIEHQPLCIECGTWSGLHTHHRVYKSQGGKDVVQNLVRLCYKCHELVHKHRAVSDKYRHSYTCPETGHNIMEHYMMEKSDAEWFKYLNSLDFKCFCNGCNPSVRSVYSDNGVRSNKAGASTGLWSN